MHKVDDAHSRPELQVGGGLNSQTRNSAARPTRAGINICQR